MNVQENQEFSSSRPATDLILDFDGGSLQSGEGYEIPEPELDGFEFKGFTPFSTGDNSPRNANEQILQIVAGVREDFADFNVNVIWDDRGVDSPFFDNEDTVIQIVDNSIVDVVPDANGRIPGTSSGVDIPEVTGDSSIQSRRDTGVVFLSAIREAIGPFGTVFGINDVIRSVGFVAGVNFGVSPASEADSDNRQILAGFERDANIVSNIDGRFSPEPLNRAEPEEGVVYSAVDRLNEAVGPASVLPGDTQSSQTLFNETFPFPSSFIGLPGALDFDLSRGEVNFLGDRDAFIFAVSEPGEYTIIQSSNESSLTPVVTLWDGNGDFISAGNVGTDGVSSITFNVGEDDLFTAYYAVAGSEADRQPSGILPDPQTGAYDIYVVGGALENNQIGSPLDDILTGDSKNNFLAGNVGDDLLEGGDGDDGLSGDAGNDTLNGGAGDDTLDGGDGDDTLDGGDGDDLFFGKAGDDILDGGFGDDRFAGGDGDDLLEGGDGDDLLFGDTSDRDDLLVDRGGDDTLDGGAGEDILYGEAGDDLLKGGRDNDLLFGNTGDDALVGQGGDDTLEGGDGNDRLWGEAGDDILNGDAGDDRLIGWRGNDSLNGGFGEDTLEGGDGDDLLKGNRDNDLLLGEAGDDRLVGQGGDDTLNGGDGDDRLWGEAGDDVLNGDAGDDFILGWKGNDSLSGGAGRDTFVFAPGQGTDIIADFSVGDDLIGLKGGLTVADVSVTTVAGNTQIAVDSETLAILEHQTLSAADIDFVLV